MQRWPRLRRSIEILAGLAVAATALPLVAKYSWVADLLTHFRLQLVAVQLVLGVTLWAAARRAWAATLLVAVGINLSLSHAYWLPLPSRAQAEPDLRVMMANVEAENTQAAGLVAQIQDEQPDIVAIIEYNAQWAARLASLRASLPQQVTVPRNDRFGIALLSRLPLVDHEIIDLEGTPAIDARFVAGGRSLRVIAAHAVPPMSRRATAQRGVQLEQLAAISAAATEPLIVLGDLNVSPYSPHFAAFLERAGLHDALVGHGPSMTWPTYFPLLGIPIDHCLLGSGWDSIAYRRKPPYGSDHYAIAVDLVLE